jgi:hypothetical protein
LLLLLLLLISEVSFFEPVLKGASQVRTVEIRRYHAPRKSCSLRAFSGERSFSSIRIERISRGSN